MDQEERSAEQPDGEDLLTIAEAAAFKKVAENTVRNAVKNKTLKHIPAQVIPIKIKRSDLEKWEPASYGGVQRAKKVRGPGRPRKEGGE